MMDCTALTKKAILEAEKIRKGVGVKMVSPLSVFDAAQKLNVDVWFKNIPSLEGIYSGGDHPGIVLGSDRPLGRQSFNCAHELGHHVFGHGYGVDEIDSRYSERNKKDPDEFLVDAFAANFLMPQFAILKAFKAREIKIQTAEPVEVYQVANYFEVGYSTLINHLAYGCNIIDYKKAEELLKAKPQEIRQSLLGKSSNSELVIVNAHWTDRAVDIRIDDQILTPHGVECEGKGIQKVEEGTNGVVFKGVLQSPTSRLINAQTGWCQFVRVMPRQYEGLAEYRHMEESEDGN